MSPSLSFDLQSASIYLLLSNCSDKYFLFNSQSSTAYFNIAIAISMPSNTCINYYKSRVLSSAKNYQLNPLQNKHKDGLYLIKNQA